MPVTDGLITHPIGVAEVCQVIGGNSTDVGYVCHSSSVNKWALFKPVVRANLLDTTSQLNNDKTWNTSLSNPWWKSDSGFYGFSIPRLYDGTWEDITDIASATWVRQIPSGTISSPYRLIDFNYYYHRAVRPYSISLPTEGVWQNNTFTAMARLIYQTSTTLGAYNLTLQHLFAGNYKFGIVASGTNIEYVKTADDLGGAINLQGCPLVTGAGTVRLTAVMVNTATAISSWTALDKQVYSLQAPDLGTDASVDCVVKVKAQNQYQVVLRGFLTADTNFITVTNPIGYSDGVQATGSMKRAPENSYYLDTITYKAVRHSDSVVVYEQDFDPGSSQPDYFTIGEMITGTFPIVASGITVNLPTLPDISDYYTITYTFNYIRDY